MSQSNFSRKFSCVSSSSNEMWPVLTIQASSSGPQVVFPSAKRVKTGGLSIDTIETEDDLQTLKKKDPFMYFSIPSVRDATMLLKDFDISSLETPSIRRNCISCPARIQKHGDSSSNKIIKRKSCISMECHSDLIMAELLGDDSFREEDKEEDDELNSLLKLLD